MSHEPRGKTGLPFSGFPDANWYNWARRSVGPAVPPTAVLAHQDWLHRIRSGDTVPCGDTQSTIWFWKGLALRDGHAGNPFHGHGADTRSHRVVNLCHSVGGSLGLWIPERSDPLGTTAWRETSAWWTLSHGLRPWGGLPAAACWQHFPPQTVRPFNSVGKSRSGRPRFKSVAGTSGAGHRAARVAPPVRSSGTTATRARGRASNLRTCWGRVLPPTVTLFVSQSR